MEQLLQKIRKLREEKGFTQEGMAFELHMSQKAYCQLENGITRLDVGRLIAISEVFGISPAELLAGSSCSYELPAHKAPSMVREQGSPLPDLHGLNHKINRLIQLLETRSPLR